jgi:hypothetical protein
MEVIDTDKALARAERDVTRGINRAHRIEGVRAFFASAKATRELRSETCGMHRPAIAEFHALSLAIHVDLARRASAKALDEMHARNAALRELVAG